MARQSILDFLLEHARLRPTNVAVLHKPGATYESLTWGSLAAEVDTLATGLIALGVAPGDRVCIAAQTSLAWILTDFAILRAGAVTVPIYASNLGDECQFIVQNAGATVVVADDDVQTAKFRGERGRLPQVTRVVQLHGAVRDDDGWVISLQDLRRQAVDAPELARRHAGLRPSSLLSITYTSGTTGRPKGVMTTHDNMLYEVDAITQIDVVRDTDVQLLFLPLAHVFAKVVQMAWLGTGHVLALAENMQTLRQNLPEVRPTLMAAVPRVFEKFYAGVMQRGTAQGGLASRLFARAVALSEARGEALAGGAPWSRRQALEFKLLRRLVFRKIGAGLREAFGGRMRVMVSGGAPLAPKIAYFLQDAGLVLLEGYGLTETSAATCVNRLGRNRIGAVGPPLPGTEVRLAEDGELLVKGRGVMAGYWQDPAATASVMRDGWFCTGDVATIDDRRCVSIVDRKKDIIVTAGGKNVAPQNIENLLKTHPMVSQVLVHGDRRNFLSALITLDPDALKTFASSHRLGNGSYAELTQKPAVYRALQAAVEVFNGQLPKHETIKKFKILEHDFSQESGELTPSLKIKRKALNQRYKSVFDTFYEQSF